MTSTIRALIAGLFFASTAVAVPLDTILSGDVTDGRLSPDQSAAAADNFGFDSLATFQFSGAGGSDCWGWTGPDGTDYAFMGMIDGVVAVNATTLSYVDMVTMTPGGCGPSWRDLKTYQHYLYVVSECSGLNQGLMVIDLQYLPDSLHYVGSFPVDGNANYTSHNLSIDTVQGFAYLEGAGSPAVYMHDLSNPEQPFFVGGFHTGGIHDVHAHDNRVYTADGTQGSFSVFDLTNKNSPVKLATVKIPSPGYVHNIWPSDDGTYVATTEETGLKTIKIWDVSDVGNISLLGEYLGGSKIAHNAHFQDGFLYVSHYESGVLALDVSSPSLPQLVGSFDTYPVSEQVSFNGCWGVYPHNSSGLVYASNDNGKLFILKSLAKLDLPAAVAINLGDENPSQVVSNQPTFYWSFRDTVGAQAGFQLEVGTDPDWSVAEMFATGEVFTNDSSLLYQGAPLVDGETYFFRIRVNNGVEWGEWRPGRFTMNRTPDSPMVLSPTDGDTLVFNYVQLKILNGSDLDGDPLYYEFEVYDDPSLSTPVTVVDGIPQSADSTSSGFVALEPDRTYYWRARTFDGSEYSGWSSTASFNTRANIAVVIPTQYGSFAEAIAAVSFGDTVQVAPGTYSEPITVFGKNIHIVGTGGPDVTTIEPAVGYTGTMVNFGAVPGAVSVSGITFIGGNTQAVLVLPGGATSTVRNCRFIDHELSGGRTLNCDNGSGLVEHCLFANNQSLAAIFASFGQLRVINNTFDGNVRGIVSSNAVIARNNSFTNQANEALIGSFIENDYNNYYGNGSDVSDGITIGPNSLSVDPMYVDAGNLDYRLDENSQLVDAGDPDPQYNDSDGSRADIGGYGPRIPTAVGDPGVLPYSYSLSNNYPNPFNPSTTIRYSVARAGHVNLSVYNSLGQLVARLVDQKQPAGEYEVEWSGRNAGGEPVATGLYFYRLSAGGFSQSRKMLLLK